MNSGQSESSTSVRSRSDEELWFPTRLYDRDDAMDSLLAAMARARGADSPGFACVLGPVGMGKTALIRDFRGRVAALATDCVSVDFAGDSSPSPGAGFLQIIRELTLLLSNSGVGPERFAELPGEDRALIAAHLPELAAFMGSPDTGDSKRPNSDQWDRLSSGVFPALHGLRIRSERPLVLSLDNLHLADALTSQSLLNLAENSGNLFMLATGPAGDEFAPRLEDFREKFHASEILELEPLSREAAACFLTDTLNRPGEETGELTEIVHAKTGGRPGLMRRFLRSLRDAEHLRVSPEGDWSWDPEAIRAADAPSTASVESEFRESEEKYRLIFSAESDAILIFHEDDQRLEDVNDAALQLYGYGREEMLKLTANEITDGPGNSLFRINELVTGKLRNISHWYHRRKDGSRFPVEISTGTFMLRGRTMICAIVRDISERKEMEDRYKSQKTYYERILNNIETDIAVLDLEFRYEYLNRRAVTDPGQRRRLIGKDDYDFAGKENQGTEFADRRRMRLRQVVDEKRSVEFEEEVTAPDGSRKYYLRKLSPILNSNKDVISIIGHGIEITERKLAEEALRDSEQEVRKLNEKLEERVKSRTHQLEGVIKELEAFSYSVSHDLRAPLRAINGFATVLLQDFSDRLDESALHYLNRIRSNAGTMAQLIDDLLEFSRLGRRRMQVETIDLEQMTRSILEDLEQINPHKSRRIRIHPLPPVQGDAKLIRQMMQNLLSNAVKFSSETEQPEIEVGFMEKNNRKVYFIKDNGAGFDMKYSDKLFGVFQRLHPRDEFEGTGVGLAIVNRIVDLHGGFVWAEGVPDQGATFYFTL